METKFLNTFLKFWARKNRAIWSIKRDYRNGIVARFVAQEFVGGLERSLSEEGNKNDTVGCIPTRWDGLSLQNSRETPVVVPGARRRARICRISRWIFCERSVRTRITRYTDALRPSNHCYNVHTVYSGRHSIRLNSTINSREDAAP